MLLPPSSSPTHTERDEKLALLAWLFVCLFVCLSQKSMRPAGMEFKLGRGRGTTAKNEREKKNQPTYNRVLSESIMGKNLAQASQAAPPPAAAAAAAAACHKSGQREEDEEEQ
jgi:hypothetical protein